MDIVGPALMRIPFRRDAFEKISVRTVLEGKAGTILRGRPVLIGFGASEIGDRLATPLTRSLPTAGVEIHAQIFHSIATLRSLAIFLFYLALSCFSAALVASLSFKFGAVGQDCYGYSLPWPAPMAPHS